MHLNRGGAVLAVLLVSSTASGLSPCRHVDPFIGTDDMGHTYPGASAPFGFVQLSPQTELVPYSFGEGYNPEAFDAEAINQALGHL